MTSRLYILAAILVCLFSISCVSPGGRETGIPASRLETPVLRLAVTGEVAKLCKDVLGYDYPAKEIVYRRKGDITDWTLMTKGRHGLITSRFVISDGEIISSEVLSSKEQRGRQISSKRFLRQFTGQFLSGKQRLSKRVDAITGATISSKAMTDAALLALRLDAGQ